ncbi:MAG: hypothetical protein QOF32_1444 [Gammaproteobacteria bacterium]|jgi:hypothetical protein|nr:hypothetical protein [Gammaproteobacteria bacterium]
MSIRMNSGTAQTGNLQIPAPSLAVVAVVNGVGSVNPADVPTAIRNGWTPMQGENWPGARVVHLSAPPGAWPVNGTITFPDGATATVTNGAAVIPIAWVNQYIAYGWGPTPVLSGLDV